MRLTLSISGPPTAGSAASPRKADPLTIPLDASASKRSRPTSSQAASEKPSPKPAENTRERALAASWADLTRGTKATSRETSSSNSSLGAPPAIRRYGSQASTTVRTMATA